ncbi:MAG: glycosyltransferase family 1 protein [Chloroflexi bacterium]|nr:MAG: glycosyltransferase family 1 protein [Chloroflexota bacterium]RLT30399.1 MAG: glycosyltransferase family 1 protein [Chloroflexota bacterium]
MSAPIRVAMLARVVYPLHGYGGIERHVYHLTTHLARLGVDITLYVQQSDDVSGLAHLRTQMRVETMRYDYTSPFLRPNSIVGRQLNYPRYTLAQGALVGQRVASGAYDIVHTQGLCAYGYAVARAADARLRAVPFFANPHGLEEYRTPDWRKRLAYIPFRAMYSHGHRQADYTIATDACTAPDLPIYLGVDAAKVVVIPSAIDSSENLAPVTPTQTHAMRTRYAPHDDMVMLSVSRLERNKGYHLYAEALARAARAGLLPERWRWILVGSGKERSALEAQVQQLGIAAHVTFAGRVGDDDLQNLYAAADMFVHPTLYEGSSLVTLEAMIHRLPVLATAAGGIPDKVFTGVNGILVSPGSAIALYDGLREILTARQRWPEWGAAGAAIVVQTFDWPVVARQNLTVYTQALDAHARP